MSYGAGNCLFSFLKNVNRIDAPQSLLDLLRGAPDIRRTNLADTEP